MNEMATEAILSRVDIQDKEKEEIIALYRNAVLSGSEAQLISPTKEIRKLPAGVYNLLVQILKDLSEGASVAILQDRNGLTTVQASRLLGMSRQFFINLLEKGEIRFHKVGTHRRVFINDLMAYKERRNKGRRAVLREMVRSENESGLYDVMPNDDLSDK